MSNMSIEPWEKFELGISKILVENDFDIFYQFEIHFSEPDYSGRSKRVLDYVAAYKGLFLVIDSKVWQEFVVPPVGVFASGKVGYTLKAIEKLFWDAYSFEFGLLRQWKHCCPRCKKTRSLRGNYVYIKLPEEVPLEGDYAFIDENGDLVTFLDKFNCTRCSPLAEDKGFRGEFTRTEIFPTVLPIIVSKIPFKTETGFKNYLSVTMFAKRFCALAGDIWWTPVAPKRVFLVQYDHLGDFLKKIVTSKKYPDVVTPSLEKMQNYFKRNPIDPNGLYFNYFDPKRKEQCWISLGSKTEKQISKASSRLRGEDLLEEETEEEDSLEEENDM